MVRSTSRVCVLLLLVFSASDALHAWEIQMQGQMKYIFEQYSTLTDDNSFFGPPDVDRQFTGGRLASVNSYLGHRLAGSTASGYDGTTEYLYFDVDAQLRLNQALRIRGHYHLGDFLEGRNSYHRLSTRPGTRVAASDGQWTTWWASMQVPWGLMACGKRPKAFGMGLNANGTGGDTTTDTLMLVSFHGPLRIGIGLNLSRRGDLGYWNPDDKNGVRRSQYEAFAVYSQGPLELGLDFEYFFTHRGAEAELAPTGTKTVVANDHVTATYDAYVKYFDGRFFLCAEAVMDDWTTRYLRNANVPDAGDGRGSRYATDYIESWRYAVEAAVLVGPARMSFLFANLPGADRRNGVLVHKQAYLPKTGYGVYNPYTYLLGYAYGAGIGAFDLNGYGYLNDAVVKGARVDYAFAANLLVYATFFKADRAGNGYGWGFIDLDDREFVNAPGGANVAGVPVQVRNPNFGQVRLRNLDENSGRRMNAFDVTAPNIPDRDLGWEFTAGMDWEILAGSVLSVRYAQWKPGKWFNYACVDKSVANRGAPNWGVNPNRTIGDVFALTLSVTQSF